jgi:hypothetical protein
MENRPFPLKDLNPPLEELCVIAAAYEPDERDIAYGRENQLLPGNMSGQACKVAKSSKPYQGSPLKWDIRAICYLKT